MLLNEYNASGVEMCISTYWITHYFNESSISRWNMIICFCCCDNQFNFFEREELSLTLIENLVHIIFVSVQV